MAKEVSKDNKNEKVKKDKKNFSKDFKAELKKVSWPTLKQLVNNTTAVIVIVLVTAAIVFVLDVIFESLNNYGVEKLKAIVTSSTSETNTENNDASNEINAENAQNTLEENNVVTEDANAVSTENTTTQE